jgi:hypothetical protein
VLGKSSINPAWTRCTRQGVEVQAATLADPNELPPRATIQTPERIGWVKNGTSFQPLVLRRWSWWRQWKSVLFCKRRRLRIPKGK